MVNIGHPDVIPIEDLAERIRAELDADPTLIRYVDQPPQMTLVKRPNLERMRDLLGVVAKIDLDEGVRRVAAVTRERVALLRSEQESTTSASA